MERCKLTKQEGIIKRIEGRQNSGHYHTTSLYAIRIAFSPAKVSSSTVAERKMANIEVNENYTFADSATRAGEW